MIMMIKKIMIMTVKEMNLDVVIEGAVFVAVVLEQSERVLVAKVLKLDQAVLAVPESKSQIQKSNNTQIQGTRDQFCQTHGYL